MRCESCLARPVEIAMTDAEGRLVTLRSCCRPVWFRDGHQVEVTDVVSAAPQGRRRRSRKAEFTAELRRRLDGVAA